MQPTPPPLMSVPLNNPPTQGDNFIMTDVLHVIEDVFDDQEDAFTSVTLIKSEPCSCGKSVRVMVCEVCQAVVCDDCLPGHENQHNLCPSETTEDSPKNCLIHEENKVTLFCQSCLTTVCQSCAQNDHTGHNVLSVADAYTRYRPSVDQLLSKSEVEINLLDLSLADAQKMCGSVGKQQTTAVERVRQVFQEHRVKLDKREQEVAVCVASYIVCQCVVSGLP